MLRKMGFHLYDFKCCSFNLIWIIRRIPARHCRWGRTLATSLSMIIHPVRIWIGEDFFYSFITNKQKGGDKLTTTENVWILKSVELIKESGFLNRIILVALLSGFYNFKPLNFYCTKINKLNYFKLVHIHSRWLFGPLALKMLRFWIWKKSLEFNLFGGWIVCNWMDSDRATPLWVWSHTNSKK